MFQPAISSRASSVLVTLTVTALLAQILILLDFEDTNTNNLHRPGTMRVVFFAAEFTLAFFIMVACVTHSIRRTTNQRPPTEDEESLLTVPQEDDTDIDGFSHVGLCGEQQDRLDTPDRIPSVIESSGGDPLSQVDAYNDKLNPCCVSDDGEEDLPLYEVLFAEEDIQLLKFAGFDLGSIGLETMHGQCRMPWLAI